MTKFEKAWKTRKSNQKTRNWKKKGLKIGLALMSIVCLVIITLPSPLKAPSYVFTPHLPVNTDKLVLTDTDRILIASRGYKYQDYLIRLAYCESRHDEFSTQYINNSKGLDRGVFQINDYFHKEVSNECAFNVECATKWTMKMIDAGRQHEWMCDPIIRNIAKK